MPRALFPLAGAVLAVLLVACGGGGDDPPASAEGEPIASTPEDSPLARGSSDAGPAEHEPDGGASGDGDREAGAKDADEPPAGPSDERMIRRAIAGFLTSGDPRLACTEAVTDDFVREAFGDRNGCAAAQTSAATARSVDLRRLDVSSGRAFAIGVPRGGASDGERLEIDLVKEAGAWRIDGLFSDVPVGP